MSWLIAFTLYALGGGWVFIESREGGDSLADGILAATLWPFIAAWDLAATVWQKLNT